MSIQFIHWLIVPQPWRPSFSMRSFFLGCSFSTDGGLCIRGEANVWGLVQSPGAQNCSFERYQKKNVIKGDPSTERFCSGFCSEVFDAVPARGKSYHHIPAGDGVHIPVLLQPSIDGPLFPVILPGLVSKGSMIFVQKTEGLPQECY